MSACFAFINQRGTVAQLMIDHQGTFKNVLHQAVHAHALFLVADWLGSPTQNNVVVLGIALPSAQIEWDL